MPDPNSPAYEAVTWPYPAPLPQAVVTSLADAAFAAADAVPVKIQPEELASMVSSVPPLPDRTPPDPRTLKLPPPGITNSANIPTQQPVPLAVNGTVSACCLVADNIIFAFTTTGYIYKVIGNPFSITQLYAP